MFTNLVILGAHIVWKDPPFLMGQLAISTAMFNSNSYVKLPEGNSLLWKIAI